MNENPTVPETIPGVPPGQASPAGEGSDPAAPDVLDQEPAVTEVTNEISETLADISGTEFVLEDSQDPTEETVSLTTQDLILSVGSDIAHTNLFGSFLICGTLIGCALLRKIYGT